MEKSSAEPLKLLHTLPAHGTKALGGVLLYPRKEAMLSPSVFELADLGESASIPYEMSARTALSLLSMSWGPVGKDRRVSYVKYNRLRGIYRLDTFHQIVLDRSRRRRLLACPTAMTQPRSTL